MPKPLPLEPLDDGDAAGALFLGSGSPGLQGGQQVKLSCAASETTNLSLQVADQEPREDLTSFVRVSNLKCTLVSCTM